MNKSPYRPKGKRFAIDMLKMILIQIIFCNDGTVDLST